MRQHRCENPDEDDSPAVPSYILNDTPIRLLFFGVLIGFVLGIGWLCSLVES